MKMPQNRTLWINRYCASPFGAADMPDGVSLVSDRAISYWPPENDLTIPASLVKLPDGSYALLTGDGIVECDQDEAESCAWYGRKWLMTEHNPTDLHILLDGEDWDWAYAEDDEFAELIGILIARKSGTITPDYTDDVADIYGRWTLYDFDEQFYAPIHAGCRTEEDFRAYCKAHYRWMSADIIERVAGIGADIAEDTL